MRIRLLIIILLLWLVEADVFQIPQLHKHLIVSGNVEMTDTDTKGRIYFGISTDNDWLDLSDFHKYLTIKPTDFQQKFERGQVPKLTSWTYSSGDLINPYYFDEIEKLIETLEPHKQEFRGLKAAFHDISFHLSVVIFLGDSTPGLHFSSRALKFLNYLDAEIDCDIYNEK